jgi:hypothetical protein
MPGVSVVTIMTGVLPVSGSVKMNVLLMVPVGAEKSSVSLGGPFPSAMIRLARLVEGIKPTTIKNAIVSLPRIFLSSLSVVGLSNVENPYKLTIPVINLTEI